MRKGVLMYGEEPTDEELAQIMHEVAVEAKEKSDKALKQLRDNIEDMIKKANSKDNGK